MIKNYAKIIAIFSLTLFLNKGQKANAQVVDTIRYTNSIVGWTVPNCVDTITIEAKGAQGGDGSDPIANPGGHGAVTKGTFHVIAGHLLKVLAGQKPKQMNGGAAGGGGGSFVWDASQNNNLLIAAGAGGGSCTYTDSTIDGAHATVSYNGTKGTCDAQQNIAPGGINGNGGGANWEGSGGAGWYSNGTNGTGFCSATYGGNTPLNGGQGGYGTAGNGGFGGGGGGGSCWYSGGGGGGYSGGAGSGGTEGGGGGGGSFDGGINQTNFINPDTGNGMVIISYHTYSVLPNTGHVINEVTCQGYSDGSACSIGNGATFTYSWSPGGQTGDTAVNLAPATYTVTVSSLCGASTTASVTITEAASLPVLTISEVNANSNNPCNGKAWANISGGTPPYAKNWSNSQVTDTITGLCGDRYCCYIQDKNGCGAYDCTTVTSPPLGINNLSSNSGDFVLYPNPNNGAFTIKSAVISGQSAVVEVYNVLGEKVYTTNLNATSTDINMNNKPSGIYMYRVLSETGTLLSQGKFVVQQ